MVTALAFVATAIASLFAEAALVRFTERRAPHLLAWTVALAMFALACAALAVGVSAGWDQGTYRVFYLFGAILNVPWLALGTVYLVARRDVGRRAQWTLVFFSGLATGVLLSAPMEPVSATEIPVGREVFGALPRALAAIGSGVGAVVILAGAIWSIVAYARSRRAPGTARALLSNSAIALGTLILSSGGLVQGAIGHDEAFTLSLVVGIAVIYLGFSLSRPLAAGRETRPAGTRSLASASGAADP